MKLWWLDLETTGLDPRRHEILEIGVAIADLERPFQAVDTYHAVTPFNVSDEALDPFIVDMHTKNGLLAECRESPTAKSYPQIEEELLKLIPIGLAREEMPVLAGSSIHFDHSFLEAHMPNLAKKFSHRHYDVSSVKLFCMSLGMLKLPRAEAHRAMADIHESIEHAQLCAEWIRSLVRT